jgi:hypothetical protein
MNRGLPLRRISRRWSGKSQTVRGPSSPHELWHEAYRNYRDSDLTKVVPASTSIVFMVERANADGCSRDALIRAQEALAASVRRHADTVCLVLLEPSTPQVDIGTG